ASASSTDAGATRVTRQVASAHSSQPHLSAHKTLFARPCCMLAPRLPSIRTGLSYCASRLTGTALSRSEDPSSPRRVQEVLADSFRLETKRSADAQATKQVAL